MEPGEAFSWMAISFLMMVEKSRDYFFDHQRQSIVPQCPA